MTSSPGQRAEASEGKLAAFIQLVKFNAVGVLNTLIDFVVFTALSRLGLPALPSQCVSYSCGIANSYLLNRNWTFGERQQKADARQAARFLLLNGLTLILSLVLLYLFHGRWGMQALAAKGIVTVFTTAVNFLGSRLWVFRKQPSVSET